MNRGVPFLTNAFLAVILVIASSATIVFNIRVCSTTTHTWCFMQCICYLLLVIDVLVQEKVSRVVLP